MDSSDVYLREAPRQFPLTYVDFVPADLSPNRGFFDKAQYERFDVLVNKANEWLSQHSGYKVVSCESYELTITLKSASTDDPIVNVLRKTLDKYLRCLRLWVASKSPVDYNVPQQVGYIYFTPNCIESGGVFSNAKFERFGDTLTRINETLRNKPLPGRIINVETQDMKVHSSGTSDPDETSWTQGLSYLNVIRVFFLAGPPAHEQIGCADFVPKMVKRQGFASMAQFEPFSAAMQQANAYIQQNPGIRILNVQSVNYKMHASMGEPMELDSHRAHFHQQAGATHYLRIVRVYHVSSASGTGTPVHTLTCKTFVPCQTSNWGMASAPRFESQSATMVRALAWLNATGARVMSSETAAIQVCLGYDPENPYTIFSHNQTQFSLMVFRVYLDGYYPEPPPQSLPPVPEIGTDSGPCCTVL